ncbi:MAG: hypothetical protein IPN94_10280 [Sphingobacteriales bacterium]|nr:hypothetical protein [Sphingobacteriales bacterium]
MGTSATLSNPSYFKGDDLPVEKVSWDDKFFKLAKTGKTKPPTEAQWESHGQ